MDVLAYAWLYAGALVAGIAFWAWNRDTQGAITLVVLIAGLISLVAASNAQGAELRAGVAQSIGGELVGRDPTGTVWLRQRLGLGLDVAYLHISSVPDQADRAVIDAAGIGYERALSNRRWTPSVRAFGLVQAAGDRHLVAGVELRQPLHPGALDLAPMLLWRRDGWYAQVAILVRFGTE